jgi:hypothetical protein
MTFRQRPVLLSTEILSFITFFVMLVLVYGFWLMVFWPGILGEDSLAILLEVENPEIFGSGKTAFWYNYVRLLYQHYHLVELPIGLILILSAFIMARILGWCWSQRLPRTTIFLLIFTCLAPHLIFYLGSLYPDGIFAVAVAGFLFEIYLFDRYRKASLLSWINIAIAFPFAVFARSNGIIFLIPAFVLIFTLKGASRLWIGVLIMGWCGLAIMGSYWYKHETQKPLYPLAIYETVNFLQPRPMKLWTDEPRVSLPTIDVLTRNHPLELYLKYYDPDYWDTLNFGVDGPRAMSLPEGDKDLIVREFFRYNLWHNIPKFMGSRVNIFLVAAFAQGGPVGIGYSKHVLGQTKSQSIYRKFDLSKAEQVLKTVHEYDYKYRWLLWTPFLGVGLMIWVFSVGVQSRNLIFLLVSLSMMAQLAGIFIFSIAGEYRYLFHFFTLPLAFLPLIVTHYDDETKRRKAHNEAIRLHPNPSGQPL